MSTRTEVGEEARALLRRAMALHADGAIDEALAAAETTVEQAPGFGDAYCYLGNTLVTRRRRFADGLVATARGGAAKAELSVAEAVAREIDSGH